jgi:serine phosphatase RsbU (regulator of sigma subunit)/anti-sigma regulatory factor (Ser/Thr protein kinase)
MKKTINKSLKKSLNRRITVYFLIILILTVAVSAVWNYYSTRESILDMEKSQAEGCTQTVSNMLQHYETAALHGAHDTEEYRYIRNAIRNFCMGFGQDALHLYTVDTAAKRRNVLLAVASDKELDSILEQEGTEVLDGSLLEKAEDAVLTERETLHREEWRTQYGRIYAWTSMFRDPDSAEPILICMEYNIETERGHILRDFLEDILLPVAALSVAFLVLMLLFKKRIAEPIRLISDRMESFARDSRRKPEPLNINSEDEIGEIACSFEKMTEDISTYVSNIEKLTQERVETDVQLDIARRIQNGLVPEKTGMDGDGFSISAMTRPAKGVGGDFYDCFEREDGSVCIVMGDVSGKGITGAIFMAMIKTVIREKLKAGFSPAETLNQANRELTAQNPEGLFCTVFAAILNPGTGELRYANAGHTYPVLLRFNEALLKPKNGIALGLFDDAEIVDETMTLAPGQGIFLYTDGVTDALNPEHIPFGIQKLTDTLREQPDARETAEETILRVSSAVGAYCEGVEPFDDMAAMVLIRTDKRSGGRMRPIPVALDSFEEIKEAAFAAAGNTPETRKALLACDEALTNTVRYSGATELAFRCEKEGDTLCVTFSDNGIPFDPTAVPVEDKEFETLDSGGMGLNLIRQTASSVRYERKDGRNIFTMRFRI